MPLVRFTDAAAELRHDPVRLAARFGVSIAAACRRLASLPQGDIGLVMCDGAGALVLRKPSDLLPLPRFGAACALWPLYAAMTRPMQPLRAVLEHAARPGARFVCYAFTQADYQQGAHMAGIFTSSMVVIPAELSDIGPHAAAADRIGTTCRVCPRADCRARREPSVLGDSADTALTAGPA
jgi:predicted transcriptional regulator